MGKKLKKAEEKFSDAGCTKHGMYLLLASQSWNIWNS